MYRCMDVSPSDSVAVHTCVVHWWWHWSPDTPSLFSALDQPHLAFPFASSTPFSAKHVFSVFFFFFCSPAAGTHSPRGPPSEIGSNRRNLIVRYSIHQLTAPPLAEASVPCTRGPVPGNSFLHWWRTRTFPELAAAAANPERLGGAGRVGEARHWPRRSYTPHGAVGGGQLPATHGRAWADSTPFVVPARNRVPPGSPLLHWSDFQGAGFVGVGVPRPMRPRPRACVEASHPEIRASAGWNQPSERVCSALKSRMTKDASSSFPLFFVQLLCYPTNRQWIH